jgi:tetratricopeptide (TPR) repeat protein
MSKQKQAPTPLPPLKKGMSDKTRNWIFITIIFIVTLVLYANTAMNYYSLDDYHVALNNPNFKQGIQAIPRIFATSYATENGLNYGYRPLVRASFALEYQFFGNNPYLSHVFNVLFYMLSVFLLYMLLRRLLKAYHPFFPFIITLLFAAHPIHTEVVASLKNRDDLFVLLFCLWSLHQFIRYADTRKMKHFIWGLVLIFLSVLSKPTAASFFLVIPLSFYFFTDLEPKKIVSKSLIIILVGAVVAIVPFLLLHVVRPLRVLENPLVLDDSFLNRIAYGGFTLYYYLRLLVFPHPLLYYYGYNVFPDINFSNILVIIGILFHLGIFIYAIMTFRKKSLLSYTILIYLTSIAMFTNVVQPAPGIIAERFLLFPSMGFSIALGYFIYRIFWQNPAAETVTLNKLVPILGLTLLILIPYSFKTFLRNQDWRTQYTLVKADMPFLYDSFKANDLYANEVMKKVNIELSKPVNVLKFVKPQIEDAVDHWERASQILPDNYTPYNNLGIVYSRAYKSYDTAIVYFNKALALAHEEPLIYFNLGQAYEGKRSYAMAIDYYKKCLKLDTTNVNTRSRLANLYYGLGEFKEAILLNQEIMRIKPGEALPYVNIGNYYLSQKDTTNAVKFYERSVELGAPAEASIFLSKYYESKGDMRKSGYYKKVADDQRKFQERQ